MTLSAMSPIFLDCKPEAWSRQSCCEMNVARYIEDHGGRMICGYRIWYNEPLYIEAERVECQRVSNAQHFEVYVPSTSHWSSAGGNH